MCFKKKISTMAELEEEEEEEEEAGCYTAKKGADMYHHFVKSCS
jgi:hypothetical protein